MIKRLYWFTTPILLTISALIYAVDSTKIYPPILTPMSFKATVDSSQCFVNYNPAYVDTVRALAGQIGSVAGDKCPSGYVAVGGAIWHRTTFVQSNAVSIVDFSPAVTCCKLTYKWDVNNDQPPP